MSKSRTHEITAPLVASFTIAIWCLAASATNLAAQTQSSNSTALAKQHYQNAVTAIANSDWQGAQEELLKAERLAPQNALVHYDLALAYSHTGQDKSVLSELNRSLQLGLPEEQKQAAVKLKQQLEAKSVTIGGGKIGTSSEPSKHSKSEIATWLVARSALDISYTQHTNGNPALNVHDIQSIEIPSADEPCHLILHEKYLIEGADGISHAVSGVDNYDFTMSQLDPERIEVFLAGHSGGNSPAEVTLNIANGLQLARVTDSRGGMRSESSISVYARENDLSQKLAMGFRDLAKQCGAKVIKDIY